MRKDDFLTLMGQRIRNQPLGHFLLRSPHGASTWVRAPFVDDPDLDQKERAKALREVYARRSCYGTLEGIEEEERRRARPLSCGSPLERKTRLFPRIEEPDLTRFLNER